MEIHERKAGAVTVLDVHGRLTLGDGDELLREKVDSVLRQGCRKLLLNLADVPYIDTGGLAAMLRAYTIAGHQHARLKLLHVSSRVQGLLTLTRLTVFEVFDDEKAAVDSFADNRG